MTRMEFLKTDAQRINRKNINSCAITGYVLAVISLILNIAVLDNPWAIIDSIFVVILSILIHTLQSRVAAIILAVYAVFNTITMTISYGRLSGWWMLVLGGYAVFYTFKFQKEWKAYKNSQAGLLDE